ncbi:hypothetical protein EXIGLDRAFT_744546 [Exidia glandulosa HHB12029]|uniref:Arrestin-like N-terminal domain-containing protein n=1 Tax=Exidia glandulosa HHB12029 TaxID=1314781 RepID=A0A165PLK4_EXIGL|nr:hypothetical protein EXIGLDRAFT_744546 [Exidia glandulosa HHB12029]
MWTLRASLVLAAYAAVGSAECQFKAWVRAEDLAPSTVSQGELKIQLTEPCDLRVTAIGVRLRFDKALVTAVYPGFKNSASNNPEFQMGDVRAVWSTSQILAATEVNEQLSQGIVLPFSVTSPSVNYPPAMDSRAMFHSPSLGKWKALGEPPVKAAHAHWAYSYLADLTFEDGSTQEVLAGYTNFRPNPEAPQESEMGPVTVTKTIRVDNARRGCSDAVSMGIALDIEVYFPHGTVVQSGDELNAIISFKNANLTSHWLSVTLLVQSIETMLDLEPSVADGESWESDSNSRLLAQSTPRLVDKNHLPLYYISREVWDLSRQDDISIPIRGVASSRFNTTYVQMRDALRILVFVKALKAPSWGVIKDEWEPEACDSDRMGNYQESFFIPITIHQSRAEHSAAVVHYLDNGGYVQSPVISTVPVVNFPTATPKTSSIVDPNMYDTPCPPEMHFLCWKGSMAMTKRYAGMLWQYRGMSGSRVNEVMVDGEAQTVLQAGEE